MLQDVSLQIGFDGNTKNTAFAAAKTLLVVGPDFPWNIPGGFLSAAIQVSKEWNKNGIADRSVSFDPALEIEVVWSLPLAFTHLPPSLDGFGNLVGPKGTDGFGANTKTEVLTEPRLTLDVGSLAFDRPRRLDAFLGYQYWLNEFGNDHHQVPGSLAGTVFLGLRYHL